MPRKRVVKGSTSSKGRKRVSDSDEDSDISPKKSSRRAESVMSGSMFNFDFKRNKKSSSSSDGNSKSVHSPSKRLKTNSKERESANKPKEAAVKDKVKQPKQSKSSKADQSSADDEEDTQIKSAPLRRGRSTKASTKSAKEANKKQSSEDEDEEVFQTKSSPLKGRLTKASTKSVTKASKKQVDESSEDEQDFQTKSSPLRTLDRLTKASTKSVKEVNKKQSSEDKETDEGDSPSKKLGPSKSKGSKIPVVVDQPLNKKSTHSSSTQQDNKVNTRSSSPRKPQVSTKSSKAFAGPKSKKEQAMKPNSQPDVRPTKETKNSVKEVKKNLADVYSDFEDEEFLQTPVRLTPVKTYSASARKGNKIQSQASSNDEFFTPLKSPLKDGPVPKGSKTSKAVEQSKKHNLSINFDSDEEAEKTDKNVTAIIKKKSPLKHLPPSRGVTNSVAEAEAKSLKEPTKSVSAENKENVIQIQEKSSPPSEEMEIDASETPVVTTAPNTTKESTSGQEVTLAVMVDPNYHSEYSRLKNHHASEYVKVPVTSSSLHYTFPTDNQFVEIHPGVIMSVTFNSGVIKTGYVRLAPQTVKPFEKTIKSQICLAVMEGQISVKSSSFEFNEKGDPVLKSVELFAGCHMCIPNNSMYTLENKFDEEASVYYSIIRN